MISADLPLNGIFIGYFQVWESTALPEATLSPQKTGGQNVVSQSPLSIRLIELMCYNWVVATQIFLFIFTPNNWGRWTHFDSYFCKWIETTTNQISKVSTSVCSFRSSDKSFRMIHDFSAVVWGWFCWASHHAGSFLTQRSIRTPRRKLSNSWLWQPQKFRHRLCEVLKS